MIFFHVLAARNFLFVPFHRSPFPCRVHRLILRHAFAFTDVPPIQDPRSARRLPRPPVVTKDHRKSHRNPVADFKKKWEGQCGEVAVRSRGKGVGLLHRKSTSMKERLYDGVTKRKATTVLFKLQSTRTGRRLNLCRVATLDNNILTDSY